MVQGMKAELRNRPTLEEQIEVVREHIINVYNRLLHTNKSDVHYYIYQITFNELYDWLLRKDPEANLFLKRFDNGIP